MPRARDIRLARLRAEAARAGSATDLERCALGARAAVCAVIGDALAQSGIDPAYAAASGLGAAAALRCARVAPLPENGASGAREQSEEFAVSDDDGLAGMFAAKIEEMARRYEGECQPDFGNASLAELLAWSLARPAHRRPRLA